MQIPPSGGRRAGRPPAPSLPRQRWHRHCRVRPCPTHSPTGFLPPGRAVP